MKSSVIQAAWQEHIFEHETIQTITELFYARPVTDQSESELSEIFKEQRVNFFEFTVERASAYTTVGEGNAHYDDETFTVSVRYTVEEIIKGDAFNEARDVMETLIDLIPSALGTNWQETVDYFIPQEGAAEVKPRQILDRRCFEAVFNFYGYIN